MNIPKKVNLLISKLEQHGYEAYAVGGCIRDNLLGNPPNDWDICTSAIPEQILSTFNNCIETGIKHGTVTVILEHQPFEVTTYRTDGEYTDNRRPDNVTFVKSLKEDLGRRDFTINAMAYNQNTGIIDYFDGMYDLENKIIRCVGNAKQRFNEDALRIMRCLRFSSVYGFNIDKETSEEIKKQKNLLKNISSERISAELCKLILGKDVERTLMNYSDVIAQIIPEISPLIGFQQNTPYHCYDVWEHTVKSIMNSPNDLIVRLTMLLHDIGKPDCYTEDEDSIGHFYTHAVKCEEIASTVLRRLKFDNETINKVKKLVLNHDIEIIPEKKNIKHILNKLGEDIFRKLLLVKYANTLSKSLDYQQETIDRLKIIENNLNDIIDEKQCFSIKNLSIDGHDLINIGISEGKIIGIILDILVILVIDEELNNTKKELLEFSINFINNK